MTFRDPIVFAAVEIHNMFVSEIVATLGLGVWDQFRVREE